MKSETGAVRFHYVIVDLNADYIGGVPKPDDDALDARWFSSTEIQNNQVSAPTRNLLKDKFNFG